MDALVTADPDRASYPLRIAVVAACPFPYPRGTPVRIHRLTEALARRGHEIQVVTYHLGEDTTGADFHVHRTPSVPTYNRYAPGPNFQKLIVLDPLLRRTLKHVLAMHPVDLIHAHHYEGLLVARSLSLVGRRTPIVYDAHTLLDNELPYYKLGLNAQALRWLGGWLDRTLPQRADHVITVSESLRNRLLELGAISPARITVVASGVEAEAFDVQPKSYDDGLRRIVFAGNLAAYQGVESLLTAFAYVTERRPGVRLQLITDSPFTPYEERARALGVREHVELLPLPFPEQPAYLRAADALINPRTNCDGVPQKLMNYMAAGRPIVSFQGSAVHLRQGENGLIVPNGDTVGMGEAILLILNDPQLAARLGAAALAESREKHGWGRAAREAERVYHTVLAKRPHRIRIFPPLESPRQMLQ